MKYLIRLSMLLPGETAQSWTEKDKKEELINKIFGAHRL